MSARTPGVPRGALVLFVILGALVAYQWRGHDDGPAGRRAGGARSPTPTPTHAPREGQPAGGAAPAAPDRERSAAAPSATRSPAAAFSTAAAPQPSDAVPSPRETLPAFDLGSIPRAPTVEPREDRERFATTQWFTREDQRHPERYFELAARLPALNRPEERRRTLEYFQAFRRQLERDLETARDGSDEHREILATMSRYDTAIARLRPLVEGPEQLDRPPDAEMPAPDER